MTYEDLEKLYEKKKKVYGKDTFKHISEILSEAKKLHKKDFKGIDHEQSWRSFKGKKSRKTHRTYHCRWHTRNRFGSGERQHFGAYRKSQIARYSLDGKEKSAD